MSYISRSGKLLPISFFRSQSIGLAALTILTLVFLAAPAISANPEVRGLWVVRDAITSESDVTGLVDFAEEHRFNVLFIQIRGRGDAYYHSYFVPGPDIHPAVPGSFDPLEEVIRRAHEKNIEVHAWFNMYLTWSNDNPPESPDHPLNKHPDWFMVSVTGSNMADCPIESVRNSTCEGRYLSPMVEEVRSYLSRMVTEVTVTYNIDGVHLDYIRFPGRDYDFHPVARYDFSGRYGVDPVEVVNGDGSADPALLYLGKWVDYRAGRIDEQVKSIRRRINLVDPNIRLSAAVKPHADEAFYQYGQNWAGWLNDGILDFAVTMSYYPDTDQLYGVMSENLQKVDPRKIVGGVGIYRTTPLRASEQISLFRDMNLLGYCLFSYTTFLENPRSAGNLSGLVDIGDAGLPREFRPYLRRIYE